MKKIIFVTFTCCLTANAIQAQFQKITKPAAATTAMPVKTAPPVIMNSGGVKTIAGTVIPTGNFTNPTNVSVLPDGKRVTMRLIKNPQNLAQNFGGIVNENVANTTKSVENGMVCTSELKTINASSATFMNVNYNQQAIQIYPGAIYTFGDFFSGNFRAFETGRNPISISTDNLANSSGATFQDVQVPTANNIRAAIATIIRPFSTTTGSAGIQYRVFTSENDADLSLKLSAGGGYAGFKASASASTQTTEKKYYLTIDAIKPLYTLMSSIPANGFFSDKSIEANNQNLIVLKSVTYGTRVLANLEITLNTQNDAVEFKASFGADSGKGISANASATFNYLKNSRSASSTANVYVVGGPLNSTLFDKDKLEAQIIDLISRCNYQTAQPIAYSFTDIGGNMLGINSATDQFVTKKCVPPNSFFKLVSAKVQINTGSDSKEQGSNAQVDLVNSDGVIVFENNNNNIELKSNNEIALNSRNLSDNYIAETSFSKNGGYVDIFLDPKPIFLGFDAWSINSAIVTLTFMDQNNAVIYRQMNYDHASAVLQKGQQRLRLPFDKLYNAGSAFMPGL
jgi:hypothetical protein